MVFDDAGPPREQQDFLIGNRKATALGWRHRDIFDSLPATDVIDQLELLRAERLLQDWPVAVTQRWFEDVVFVGIDCPLDDILAKAVCGVDQYCVAKTGFGIDSKHHARCAEVGADHALHTDGERDLVMVETFVGTIRDRPVSKERSKATPARMQQRVAALHIEIRLLLARKARVRQVLSGGAATHSDIKRMRGIRRQLSVCLGDRLLKVCGYFRRHDRMPHAGPARAEVLDIARIQISKDISYLGIHAGLSKEVAISLGGDCEPVGDLHTRGCQFAIHLSERGVLPANQRDIVDADFIKPPNVPYRTPGWCSHRWFFKSLRSHTCILADGPIARLRR